MAITKLQRRKRIKYRIRKITVGVADRPRLSVYRSNKEIYVQIIDDNKGITLFSVSSRDKGVEAKGNKTEVAKLIGKLIAEKAVVGGVTSVAFDRNGYLYHGRVRTLAESAREFGLKF